MGRLARPTGKITSARCDVVCRGAMGMGAPGSADENQARRCCSPSRRHSPYDPPPPPLYRLSTQWPAPPRPSHQRGAAVAGRRARLARAPQARLLRVRKAPAALHHIRGPVSSFNSRGYQTRIGRRYLSIPILRARSITCLVHSSMNLSRASAMHYFSHSIILDLHLPAID